MTEISTHKIKSVLSTNREASTGYGKHGFLPSVQGLSGLRNIGTKNGNVQLDIEHSSGLLLLLLSTPDRSWRCQELSEGFHSPNGSMANFPYQFQQMVTRIPFTGHQASAYMFLFCIIILSLCLNVKHLTVYSSICILRMSLYLYSPTSLIKCSQNVNCVDRSVLNIMVQHRDTLVVPQNIPS